MARNDGEKVAYPPCGVAQLFANRDPQKRIVWTSRIAKQSRPSICPSALVSRDRVLDLAQDRALDADLGRRNFFEAGIGFHRGL